jgi:hypothetical protein
MGSACGRMLRKIKSGRILLILPGPDLTVGNFSAIRILWSVWDVATLSNRVVLSVATPRDTLLFQKVNDGVRVGTSDVDRVVRVPTQGRGSNVIKVVWLRKSTRYLHVFERAGLIRPTCDGCVTP